MITRPMLAGKVEDRNAIRFPVIASPKLDGIRCLVVKGQALTRSFKLIPNLYIGRLVSALPNGLDGELMSAGNFQDTGSGVMSRDGEPQFTYNVFDHVKDGNLDEPFDVRAVRLATWGLKKTRSFVKVVPQHIVHNLEQLEIYEELWLKQGYEGAMIRDPKGPYKCGRSTWKQGWLLKLKKFVDAEATVIEVLELMHNTNDAFEGELGQTKRSSAQAGKVPGNTLGKLVVRTAEGVIHKVGVFNGLQAADKKRLWDKREELIGKTIKYRYQEQGTKDKPRIPVFLGWRSELDL